MKSFWKLARGSFFLWFGFIWAIGGLGACVASLQSWAAEVRMAREGIRTTGTVVRKEIQRADSKQSRTQYLAVLRFRDETGADAGCRVAVQAERWESLREGSPVEVTYLPSNPGICREDERTHPIAALIPVGLSLIVGGTGLALVVIHLRRILRELRLRREGVPVEAAVTAIRSTKFKTTGGYLQEIVYTFEDGLGVRRHGKSAPLVPAEAFQWSAGDSGLVHYDRAHPEHSAWIGRP